MSTTPPTGALGATGLPVFSKAQTADLLDFHSLVPAIAVAALAYDAGSLQSPPRQVVPIADGGVMLSMPATAPDVAIHKLVNVQPSNGTRQLPTIHGIVTVCDAQTGVPQCVLDGPEVTGRRTAAVSLLAIDRLLPHAPAHVLIVGTGAQADYHMQGLHAVYPQARISVRGSSAARAAAFCDRHRPLFASMLPCQGPVPGDVEVVILLTTSREPVYNEPARTGRVVIGVGAFKPEMAEIGKATLDSSALYADDPVGAQHEAGDLLRAGVDWARVQSLAHLVRHAPPAAAGYVFKSVGNAAWDLAAARVALANLKARTKP